MAKILLVDNFDSFTFNLYHYLDAHFNGEVTVFRNNELANVNLTDYSGIVLSPGPGLPSESGDLLKLIKAAQETIPILGVCLGHQAIANSLGFQLKNLKRVIHGQSRILNVIRKHDELYKGLPQSFKVARYHSWVIDNVSITDDIEVTAEDEEGHIMSFKHNKVPLSGVQYHPESVLTEYGQEIIKNWLASLIN